mmetsp:Transcript_3415/g.7800  ORF Transcript_3415/g.7800 Transcript_3415/m.7800 type:complete len:203 (-) Transcript_3415:1065-1673(-)
MSLGPPSLRGSPPHRRNTISCGSTTHQVFELQCGEMGMGKSDADWHRPWKVSWLRRMWVSKEAICRPSLSTSADISRSKWASTERQGVMLLYFRTSFSTAGTTEVRMPNMCVCTCGVSSQLTVGPTMPTWLLSSRDLKEPIHSPSWRFISGPRTPVELKKTAEKALTSFCSNSSSLKCTYRSELPRAQFTTPTFAWRGISFW